jgi:NO-binding membrane sensor protein with MHYT domain
MASRCGDVVISTSRMEGTGMAQIHHFDHGWITPTVSYVLSVLGSMLGLTCAVRLREAKIRSERIWWLVLASVSIGGTAIWSMHFVAMLGFSVVGTPIRYDVGLTAASAIIPIVAVAVGLAITALGTGARNARILIGGILAGLGVAAMHYTGMAAMHLNGDIMYSSTRVGLSIGIAVVAAAVALWLAMTVRKPLVIFGAALVMGVAVNGMHFTGMSAMSVDEHTSANVPSGASASSLIVPIGLAVVFGIIGLAYALMAAPTEEDREAAAYLAARRDGLAAAEAAAAAQQRPPFGGAPEPQQPNPTGLGTGAWTYRDRTPGR